MVGWLYPVALAGLIAAAGPIAVHLLRRRRAGRLPFASVRFVRAASTAAVRLRVPSDFWLLMLRVAIVCGAAMALAQPVVVTPGRRAAWDARVSRAVVVDTSASMAAASRQATAAAAAEARGATHVVRTDAPSLRDGLRRAADAMAQAVPSRREIVVVSDFQVGSLTAADVGVVPGGIGLRFVDVGAARTVEEFPGDVAAAAPGIEARLQHIRPTPAGTVVRISPADARLEGLRLPGAGPAGDALLRAVARAGAPAPSAHEPLALTFTSNPTNPTNLTNPATWMLRTILAMRRDRSLTDAAREHRRSGPSPGSAWLTVARDGSGAPVVAAAASANELLFQVAGGPSDYLAAATLRSALVARRGEPAWGEQESERIPAVVLGGWTRTAGPVDPAGNPGASHQAPGDARWAWLAVLALLAVETMVRRPARRQEPGAHARVA